MGHHQPFLSSRTVTLRGERLPQILGQVALTVSRVQGTEGLNSLFTYTRCSTARPISRSSSG